MRQSYLKYLSPSIKLCLNKEKSNIIDPNVSLTIKPNKYKTRQLKMSSKQLKVNSTNTVHSTKSLGQEFEL
jgi:hypothetical protein